MPKKTKQIKSDFLTLPEFQKVSTESKYKVGLALCGGIAYGVAQIGILKALEEAGIKVDCLAGTSAGAIIAAAYASGLPVSRIEEIGIQTRPGDEPAFLPPLPQRFGFFRAD